MAIGCPSRQNYRLRFASLFGQVLGTLHFGHVRLARSHIACVAFAGFGCNDWLAVGLSAPDAVASVTADGEFAGRAQVSRLRFSASSSKLYPHRHPARLTSHSSRRRISASLKLLGMRAILAPIRRVRRGLIPALGVEKRSVIVFLATAVHRLRLAMLFGQALSTLPLRQHRLPRSQFACVTLAALGSGDRHRRVRCV